STSRTWRRASRPSGARSSTPSRSRRTASAASPRSPPRSPTGGGGSTRSASPTAAAPTPTARRSAGATGSTPCAASCGTPPPCGGSGTAPAGHEVTQPPTGDEDHRLGDDPPRHLGAPEAAVGEHDRRLHHAAAGPHEAAHELGEEGVALGR